MVTFTTSDGPLAVSELFLRAVGQNADRRADLAVAAPDATAFFAPEPPRLPIASLPEYSAVLELGYRQRQGVRRDLDMDSAPTVVESYSLQKGGS